MTHAFSVDNKPTDANIGLSSLCYKVFHVPY